MSLVEGDILIVYDAIEYATGWTDTIWICTAYNPQGQRRSTVRQHPIDRDEALKIAEQAARDEAARFIGDWRVTVQRRCAP